MWDAYQASLSLAVILVSHWCGGPGVLLCRQTVPVRLSMQVACHVGKTLLQIAGMAALSPSLQESDAVL